MLWCWFKVYLKLNKSLFFISSPLWNGFKRCQSYRLQPDSCLVSQISPQITISTTLHLYFFSSLATFVCECIHSVRWGHKDFQMLSMFINVWVCRGCYILSWFCGLVISSFDNIRQPGIHTHVHTNTNVKPKASKAHPAPWSSSHRSHSG